MMLASCTKIGCSLVLLTVTVSQHPRHTLAFIALLTLKNSSTAAGVTRIVEAGIVVPSIAIVFHFVFLLYLSP